MKRSSGSQQPPYKASRAAREAAEEEVAERMYKDVREYYDEDSYPLYNYRNDSVLDDYYSERPGLYSTSVLGWQRSVQHRPWASPQPPPPEKLWPEAAGDDVIAHLSWLIEKAEAVDLRRGHVNWLLSTLKTAAKSPDIPRVKKIVHALFNISCMEQACGPLVRGTCAISIMEPVLDLLMKRGNEHMMTIHCLCAAMAKWIVMGLSGVRAPLSEVFTLFTKHDLINRCWNSVAAVGGYRHSSEAGYSALQIFTGPLQFLTACCFLESPNATDLVVFKKNVLQQLLCLLCRAPIGDTDGLQLLLSAICALLMHMEGDVRTEVPLSVTLKYADEAADLLRFLQARHPQWAEISVIVSRL